jgi:hypothetical protein
VAAIIALIILMLITVGLVTAGARDHDLTTRRSETMRAFYAMEAGINMATRELLNNADDDADGTIGSISDDNSDASDPSIGDARVRVRKATSGSNTTLTSVGRCGSAARSAIATFQ